MRFAFLAGADVAPQAGGRYCGQSRSKKVKTSLGAYCTLPAVGRLNRLQYWAPTVSTWKDWQVGSARHCSWQVTGSVLGVELIRSEAYP